MKSFLSQVIINIIIGFFITFNNRELLIRDFLVRKKVKRLEGFYEVHDEYI